MLDLHLYPEEVCEMLVIAAYRDMDVKLQFTKSIFSEFPLMHDCQKCLIEPMSVEQCLRNDIPNIYTD